MFVCIFHLLYTFSLIPSLCQETFLFKYAWQSYPHQMGGPVPSLGVCKSLSRCKKMGEVGQGEYSFHSYNHPWLWISALINLKFSLFSLFSFFCSEKTLDYFWTLWERATVGWFGRMALKHVYYHMWNELPVQVRCMIQGAQGWCTEMTQRDGTGREVRGGFRMGNTCTPVADSCWCMAKPIQYCKVISLQLK